MVEVPLSWKLSVQGAEDVKARLQDINNQFQRGEISTQEYAKGLREVGRDARALTAQTSIQNKIFLAQFPILNTLSRSMSTLSHISSVALQISNSLNLMWLRQNQTSSQKLEIERDMAESQRKINRLIKEGKTGTEEYANAVEQLNIDQARFKELTDQEFQQSLSNSITLFSSMATSIGVLTPQIIKLIPHLRTLGTTLGTMPLAGFGLAGVFVAIAAFSLIAGKVIADFLVDLFGLDEWRENNGKLLEKFFLEDIPNAFTNFGLSMAIIFPEIQAGLNGFANAVIMTMNSLGSGLVGGLNIIITTIQSFVNSMIRIYNSIASKLSRLGVSIPKLSPITLPTVTFTAIPLIAAAQGFEGMVNRPTMFLAGEAGQETVSITPRNRGASQASIIIHNHIAGHIWTTDQLFKELDDRLKTSLKRLGFSGF